MTRRAWIASIAAVVVAAGVAGLLLIPSASPSHSRSYMDGYAYGRPAYLNQERMGSNLCNPASWGLPVAINNGSNPVPKGDNIAQFVAGCYGAFA